MSSPPPPRAPLLTATLLAAYLTGGLSSISLLAIPALATSPSTSTLITQFTKMYAIGRTTQPPLTLLTSLLFCLSAYQARRSGAPGLAWKALGGAGACLVAMLGFTAVVLEPTSHALMDAVHYHDVERNDGQEEGELLRRWGRLNGVRAGMAGLAMGLGGWALLR